MTDLTNAPTTVVPEPGAAGLEPLPTALLLHAHELMLTSRVLEERLIRMQKQGQGYFWIGGPGEEAFNVALGLLVDKGHGLDHDYLHLHYRSSATLLAMGADPVDAIRQMANVATDPYSGGRNFAGHYSKRDWNVCPISSPIEVQYSISIGTGIAQRRHGGTGLTIVQGGDAGTAEGDFATCLVWASRPGNELPMLIVVTNNEYGISTPASTQHGEQHIADRGKAFRMRTKVIDGNDIEVAYREIEAAMAYIRKERKPFLLEARVSRLYGHSSSSGANFVDGEVDCLAQLEQRLHDRGLRSRDESEEMRKQLVERLQAATREVLEEPRPTAESIWDHVFADRNVVGESTAAARVAAGNGHGAASGNGNGGA
ncbi:MAG TPA: thiamine pyrophosphate-dependent dehydrogenase E1 component subunit alpha [Polyangiaceae bacterium LLY-WYZ-14_1]|jgi:2-oxoisovalerate dehydrogenase E1 component alpha subunit|nr:thiamine pyrophosphate-dependent dehydrogenase E1 component subunit alpha [Polyangiaceae bacterium LLY-WYZ-14_1]